MYKQRNLYVRMYVYVRTTLVLTPVQVMEGFFLLLSEFDEIELFSQNFMVLISNNKFQMKTAGKR